MNADTLLYLIEWGVLVNLCILPIYLIIRMEVF